MAQKIIKFFTRHKYALIWTACYFAMMWIILAGLFQFNMFSAAHWSHLMRAQLRGFPGFVFGILILAAAPMYVATTMLIVRTGKPLFTIPVPKVPQRLAKLIHCKSQSSSTTDTADAADSTPAPIDTPPPPLPAELPNELRAAFMRMRENPHPTPDPVDAPMGPLPATPTPATDDQMVPDGLPLPTNFDFAAPTTPAPTDTPVFKEISFGTTPPQTPGSADTPSTQPTDQSPTTDPELIGVIDYLKAQGHDATICDHVIICGDMAIGVHDDPDFWIADATDWFASGKQKPSPIAAAQRIAESHQLKPVIYLGTKNIMDIDACITQWTDQGIRVVTDLNNL